MISTFSWSNITIILIGLNMVITALYSLYILITTQRGKYTHHINNISPSFTRENALISLHILPLLLLSLNPKIILFTSITGHIHHWVLFLFWLRLFILSGVISPLISSLGTYWPGDFIFSVLSFCLFILFMEFSRQEYWSFSIPFSSGPCFVQTLHHDPSILGGPTQHGSKFHWVRQAVIHVISLISFLW